MEQGFGQELIAALAELLNINLMMWKVIWLFSFEHIHVSIVNFHTEKIKNWQLETAKNLKKISCICLCLIQPHLFKLDFTFNQAVCYVLLFIPQSTEKVDLLVKAVNAHRSYTNMVSISSCMPAWFSSILPFSCSGSSLSRDT